MGISIARGRTEAGTNSPKRPEKRGDSSSAVEAAVRVPLVLHKDKFVNQRIVTYRQVHTDSNRPESRGSDTSLIEWIQVPTTQNGTENCGSSLKE